MVTAAVRTKPSAPRRAREIARDGTHHRRVGQRHLHAHAVAHVCREHAHLHDGAFGVADAHVFAHAKRARVHEDEPACRLADEARRADRHHEAEQHRQALEGVGVGAGDVRIGHHQREHPHGNGEELARRPRRVAVDPSHAHAALLDVVEERPLHAVDGARDHEDHARRSGSPVSQWRCRGRSCVAVSNRNAFSCSPQARVYGNRARTKPSHSYVTSRNSEPPGRAQDERDARGTRGAAGRTARAADAQVLAQRVRSAAAFAGSPRGRGGAARRQGRRRSPWRPRSEWPRE